MKKQKSLIIICLSFIMVFCSCSIKSTEDYYKTEETKNTDVVNVKVDCITALSSLPDALKNGNYIPEDGIIIDTAVEYKDGDTPFTVLTKAAKKDKIQIDYNGEGTSVYLRGISHLYEFDCGSLSGWMVCINGEFTNVGANSINVKPNDTVEWRYTCDLGNDIGNSYTGE
ncbi:MAG: DUF4430 domain-containing protein [Ruminococcus sp.]|nr:DUF4430 domain-containing protein [Ruminococcus sp.]